MREQRAFCRYICPLGLMLGLLNRISIFRIKLDKSKCHTCSACESSCPMGLNLPEEIDSTDCIKCGQCIDACPSKFNAIQREINFGFASISKNGFEKKLKFKEIEKIKKD